VKIASFIAGNRRSWGVVEDGGVIDLGARAGTDYPSASEALAVETVMDIAMAAAGLRPDLALEEIELLPPAPRPGKIICVGLNYRSHLEEMNRPRAAHPTVFPRFADTLVGAGKPLLRPAESVQFDFEGELAAVIGSPAWHVDARQAEEHIAGYTVFNDASVRDFQHHTSQFTPGKNFPGTGACGPWLVTRDEFGPLPGHRITTRLGGEVVQQADLADMLFSVPELVAYVSSWTELRPGDLLVTGTPGGVGAGRTPPLWMRPSDHCEVEIEGIGVLANPVVSADPAQDDVPVSANCRCAPSRS